MLDVDGLFEELDRIGLESWREPLATLIHQRLADGAHGHLTQWREVVASLSASILTEQDRTEARALLKQLAPWRKGPFRIQGIDIDSEWRSDMKWDRLRNDITSLADRNILDVGCGNGYYALRMLDAGARCVVGIDPTVLFVCQFEAIRKMTGHRPAYVLPLRLEELPRESRKFDTTFSMGVLYHRRNPLQHLRELLETLRPGGELVLETLVLPGDGPNVLEPENRYARMRNVWHLPTVDLLRGWITDAGFDDVRVVDVTATTTAEQRTTEWMPFESLTESLDPNNPKLTVEGLPAPTRAIFVATSP